jgi:hypothetical protein
MQYAGNSVGPFFVCFFVKLHKHPFEMEKKLKDMLLAPLPSLNKLISAIFSY